MWDRCAFGRNTRYIFFHIVNECALNRTQLSHVCVFFINISHFVVKYSTKEHSTSFSGETVNTISFFYFREMNLNNFY